MQMIPEPNFYELDSGLSDDKECAYSSLTPPTSNHSLVQKVKCRSLMKELMASPGSAPASIIVLPLPIPCSFLLTLIISCTHALTTHTSSYFLEFPHQYSFDPMSPLPGELFLSSCILKSCLLFMTLFSQGLYSINLPKSSS